MKKETFIRLVKSLELNKDKNSCHNCGVFEDAIIDAIELEFGPEVRDYVVYYLYEKELFQGEIYRNASSVEELYEIISNKLM